MSSKGCIYFHLETTSCGARLLRRVRRVGRVGSVVPQVASPKQDKDGASETCNPMVAGWSKGCYSLGKSRRSRESS